MLNERLLRDHPERIREALRRRRAGAEVERALVDWLTLDAQRRALATRYDELSRVVHAVRRRSTPPSRRE